MFAVACDGRSRHDAGLTLEELAALMAALGCVTALNLDGGGSTSLVSGGRLRNRPRGDWERAGGRRAPGLDGAVVPAALKLQLGRRSGCTALREAGRHVAWRAREPVRFRSDHA